LGSGKTKRGGKFTLEYHSCILTSKLKSIETMKIHIIGILFLLFVSQTGFPQNGLPKTYHPIEPAEVLSAISTNRNSDKPELDKLITEDSLLNLLRLHYDYLSHESKFKLAGKIQDKARKIILYRTVRLYPYYTTKHQYYGMKFYLLYIDATRDLISEYQLQGSLDELYNLDIVPSARVYSYGFLRSAIEALGGVWDKGEIIDPESTRRGTRHKQ
jgi:hypothetical protein